MVKAPSGSGRSYLPFPSPPALQDNSNPWTTGPVGTPGASLLVASAVHRIGSGRRVVREVSGGGSLVDRHR